MANFQVSLISPITDAPDITISSGVATITDHSNYDESVPEAGHARADFKDFYKMLITSPTGVEYLYSSIGDGDAVVTTPDAGDPVVDYTYLTGDGQYFVIIYTLPTYSASASYYLPTAPYVYDSGIVYKCIQSGVGQTPASSPTYWEVVASIDSLPAKYRLEQRTVIYADSKKFYARKIYTASVVNGLVGNNWEKVIRDPDVILALEALIDINAIPICLETSRFAEIDILINHLKQLASVGEVL
jgi:hypothetical protein